MPIYEYRCSNNHISTEWRHIEDRHNSLCCPLCGSEAQLQISTPNFTMGYATSKPVVDASGKCFRQKIIDKERDILEPLTSREV